MSHLYQPRISRKKINKSITFNSLNPEDLNIRYTLFNKVQVLFITWTWHKNTTIRIEHKGYKKVTKIK